MARDIAALQKLEDRLAKDDDPDTAVARLGGYAEQLYERYTDLFHRRDEDPLLSDIEAALRAEIEQHFTPPPADEEWRESLEENVSDSDEWRRSIPPDESEEWRESLREDEA